MYSVRYFEFNPNQSEKFLNLGINERISTSYQKALNGFDDELNTAVRLLEKSENDKYKKYLIEHEQFKNISGRYKNEPINYYIAANKIELFCAKESNHIIVKGKSDIVKSALEKLSDSGIIKIKDYSINILKLRSEMCNIFVKGAWFANLNIHKVESAAIFGSSVDDSDMWGELETKGDISAIVLQLSACDPLSVMISKTGSLVFYKIWDERQSLEIVTEFVRGISEFFKYER